MFKVRRCSCNLSMTSFRRILAIVSCVGRKMLERGLVRTVDGGYLVRDTAKRGIECSGGNLEAAGVRWYVRRRVCRGTRRPDLTLTAKAALASCYRRNLRIRSGSLRAVEGVFGRRHALDLIFIVGPFGQPGPHTAQTVHKSRAARVSPCRADP
jgi:hypothetical protein